MSALSVADRRAHEAAQGPVRAARPKPRVQRIVLKRVPAGEPRGLRIADDFAAAQRRQGIEARVVMDIPSDSFLVITEAPSAA